MLPQYYPEFRPTYDKKTKVISLCITTIYIILFQRFPLIISGNSWLLEN